ncbi:MAG: LexA family transcriptional regulator [Chitinophagales bacterium]|nr:LexA family transcriptional regulator [Chitinophagales bacterium]
MALLQSNLKYLREKKKLAQGELAKLLGVSRSTYANYENGQSELPVSQLVTLAQFYEIGTDDLLLKDLSAPMVRSGADKADSILSENIRILPVAVSDNLRTNIELVSAKATAGYVIGMRQESFISELPRFYLPKLSDGTYRAFEIEGDSMPPMQSGYIIIGRFVEHARDLKSGGRYIIVIRNEGIVFKRVISELDLNQQLILASDNPEYLPYTVSATDVLEAWEFTAFIGFPDKLDINYLLLDKLHQIQHQLTKITTAVN